MEAAILSKMAASMPPKHNIPYPWKIIILFYTFFSTQQRTFTCSFKLQIRTTKKRSPFTSRIYVFTSEVR